MSWISFSALTAACLLVFCPGSAAFAEFDGRLPVSRAVPLEWSGLIPDAARSFRVKYGPICRVYWDHELDTPRYLSPRAAIPIASRIAEHAEDRDVYLQGALQRFIDGNREFFGVIFSDLIQAEIRALPGGWLASFGQSALGVPIRGAGLRAFIRRDGNLGFIKSFLLRDRPQTAPRFIEAGKALEEIGKAAAGLRFSSIGMQYIFPAGNHREPVPVWNARGRNSDEVPVEVFADAATGVAFEERHFIFELSLLEGQLLGVYPDPDPANPDYQFFTPDNLSPGILYPVMGARVGTKDAVSGTDETGFFKVIGGGGAASFDWFLEAGDVHDYLEVRVDNRPEKVSYAPANGTGFTPTLRLKYDISGCLGLGVVGDDEDNNVLPLDREARIEINRGADVVLSARLMSFQRTWRFLEISRARIHRLDLHMDDRFPLDLVISGKSGNQRFYFPDREFPRICLAHKLTTSNPNLDEEQWLTPTLLNHEYAHHIIYSLTQVLQSVSFDCFEVNSVLNACVERSGKDLFDQAPVLEGVTDALAAFYAGTPRFGYYAGGITRGPLAYDISRLDETKLPRKRLLTANVLWKIRQNFLRGKSLPFEAQNASEQVQDLLYYWISLNRVPDGTVLAFDFSFSMMDELLDADDCLFGNCDRSDGTPHRDLITGAFDGMADLARVPFVRGDTDQGGTVEISDAINSLRFLFWGEYDPRCIDALDVDDGGSIDISDAVGLLTYLFVGGQEPMPPFPACGFDPTEEDLGYCFNFSVCPVP